MVFSKFSALHADFAPKATFNGKHHFLEDWPPPLEKKPCPPMTKNASGNRFISPLLGVNFR